MESSDLIGETERLISCDIVRRSKFFETHYLRIGKNSYARKFEEIIMKLATGAIAAALITAALPAFAATNLYTSPEAAAAACGADEVVWIDLDRGKFYHKNQDKFAKGSNGGYACFKDAHANYREAHE